MRCVRVGQSFDGTIKTHFGQNKFIKPGSANEALIATWMELHCGFWMTTLMVNEHRKEEGKDFVSRYAVMNRKIVIWLFQTFVSLEFMVGVSYGACAPIIVVMEKILVWNIPTV
mmetsp:Transcript_14233/g.14416  ORF Transcript_14233/g.14416 Transcript_14233/m.14416 type:complete len:114 (-) Transcript_14233:138-479(-)